MSMRQLVLKLAPRSEPTFDSFVTGENAELLTRLRGLAAGRLSESIVYVWGAEGSGRSHLLDATRIAAASPARIVIVDDVDALDQDAQIALFNRINEVRESAALRASPGRASGAGSENTAVLASGSAPPAQLALRDDLKSRLAWGLVYQVRSLSDADKAAYLREAAARRGLPITDEIVAYLLSHVRRDLPTLVSILAHLDEYSLSRQRPITLPLVRDALAEIE